MDLLSTIILGIIEGLTEFLPISSTGHMIIAQPLLRVDPSSPQWQVFLFVSQFGAILAVVVYFWRDLWQRTFHPQAARFAPGAKACDPEQPPLDPARAGAPATGVAGVRIVSWKQHILTKLLIAFVPALVLGVAFNDLMEQYLEKPVPVAGALIVGAFGIQYIDWRYRRSGNMTIDDVTLRQAFLIGLAQCVSIWPGVSRAAATIMGGMVVGLTPSLATEFSFYLAIPTMLAASAYRLFKYHQLLTWDALGMILVGSLVAFIVALAVVAAFMSYVRRRRFTPFAVYRVMLGAAVLTLYFATNLSAL